MSKPYTVNYYEPEYYFMRSYFGRADNPLEDWQKHLDALEAGQHPDNILQTIYNESGSDALHFIGGRVKYGTSDYSYTVVMQTLVQLEETTT